MNYSKSVTVDDTGNIVIEFMPSDLDSLIMTADQDFYWGIGDLSQAVVPVLKNGSVNLNSQDFKNQTLERILSHIEAWLGLKSKPYEKQEQPIRIYAKRQIAGNVTISIAYLGGNLRV